MEKRAAFTLIELLVVIPILVAMSLPINPSTQNPTY
jgi:prepilin-type N-terminal cleavage/methylation domain-containing protein